MASRLCGICEEPLTEREQREHGTFCQGCWVKGPTRCTDMVLAQGRDGVREAERQQRARAAEADQAERENPAPLAKLVNAARRAAYPMSSGGGHEREDLRRALREWDGV